MAQLPRPLLGLYGSPEPIWKLGRLVRDTGANFMVISHKVAKLDLVSKLKAEGLKVFADFACFAGKALAQKHPDLWPIGEDGKKLPVEEWYLGLCPTKKWYREQLLSSIERAVRELPLEGVWLDFIRYPTKWESPQPTLRQACFCPNCLKLFRERTGFNIPIGDPARAAQIILSRHQREWVEFKIWVITSFIEEVRKALDKVRRGLVLGCFTVPWTDDDFDGAIKKILAQDFARMAEFVDVFSPMVYHRMVGKPVKWVGEYAQYLKGKVKPRLVVPIVQAVDHPEKLRPGELSKAILLAVENSDGAMVFTARHVAASPAKFEEVKASFARAKGRL